MNTPGLSDDELDALFARARAVRPDTSAAEYGFETRLMARLRAARGREAMPLLGALSWRLLPVFGAIAVGLAVWHEHVAADVSDAEQISCLQNLDGTGIGDGLN